MSKKLNRDRLAREFVLQKNQSKRSKCKPGRVVLFSWNSVCVVVARFGSDDVELAMC